MATAAALPWPEETPALTVVPGVDVEERAWNFGDIPVQGELFPRDFTGQ